MDTSLAAMWALPEDHTERALALAEAWAAAGRRVLAPALLVAEVTNAVYKRVVRKELELATARKAIEVVFRFAVELHEEPGLPIRALELAHALARPTTYDCHYLALAEHHDCELWTGDGRFYRAVRHRAPRVRWVGEE